MIEIDLAPAPSPSSSTPSASRGAAEDFAAALQEAGGRDAETPRDRASETARRDDRAASEHAAEPQATEQSAGEPTVESPSDQAETSADAEAAETEPVVDGVDESNVAESADIEDPVAVAPLPAELMLLNTAAPVQPIEPAMSADAAEATAAEAAEEILTGLPVETLPDAAADGIPTAVAEVVAGVEAVESADGSVDPETDVSVPAMPLGEEPVTGVPGETDGAEVPVATAVGTEADLKTAGSPGAVAITDEVAEHPDDVEVPVAGAVPEPATMTAADAEPGPAPAASVAPSPTAAPSAEATAAAVAEVAIPTQAATPAAATTVDPLAAADAAAAAEIDVPTPPQQIAEALRDVRRMADGSHRLSLQLHPEELGVVQLEVAVRDGQLHLRAATELDSTRRLLNASLPELRTQLADAGVTAGSLEVGAETAGGDRSARDDSTASTTGAGFNESPSADPTGVADASTLTAPGRLDVRL